MIRNFVTRSLAVAAIAVTAVPMSAYAHKADGYWGQGDSAIWRDSSNQCWQTGYWTPAMAIAECHPDLVKKPAPPPPAAAPRAAPPPPPPAPAPRAAPPKPRPVAEKVTLAADVLFDFDKSVIKPEGRSTLDGLVGKINGVNLEVAIAIGHTDSIGSRAYNQKLSVRRAEAVKAYLVSKGIAANRIYTEGKGELQPVASNRTRDGRAKNRRVEIEVIGTKK